MTITRRIFLQTGTAASAGLILGIGACSRTHPPALAPGDVTMWLHIFPDDQVLVRVNSSELGQGAQTGLAQILCDELDGDWRKLSVEMAPVTDPYMVRDGGYYTGGSQSIAKDFGTFAKAGATARALLIAAAASRWSVDAGQCRAENGVVHGPSGQTLTYGAVAQDASRLPLPDDVALKPRAARKLIGKPVARLDIPDKVNGRAIYGIDVKRPGMLIATIAQCPFFGGALRDVDEKPALAVKGVRKVVRLENAVAVVATNFWSAKKGLAALAPAWTKPDNAIASDDAMIAVLRAQMGAGDSTVVAWPHKDVKATVAEVDAALASGKVFDAEYEVQLLAHAPIEPMNATAIVNDGSCELWASMQAQSDMRGALAEALDLPKTAIVLHTTETGGGFGRRLQTDYGVQAARIARAVKAPVKLIWTREEDFGHDFYRPASIGRVRAALNDDLSLRALDLTGATTNDIAIGGWLLNYPAKAGAVRQKRVSLQLPTGSWRSVDPSITVFFLESFIDEIAHASNLDPLEYRRRLLKDSPRALRTLDTAAAMANWGSAQKGRVQGIAFFGAASWGTCVAEIVELSVDTSNRITLHKAFCAIDPGLAVNPDQIAAQAMGGMVLGLSAALGEAITLKDGQVEQRNFDTYSVPRLGAVPDIDVRVLESEGTAPGGCGEPPVPPAAPALANALFAATGKRIRRLPLSRSGFSV